MLALPDLLVRSVAFSRKATSGPVSPRQSVLAKRLGSATDPVTVERVMFARDPRAGRKLIARPMTIEQWADMDEDEPGEFYDGYVVEEEVANPSHELIVVWLLFALKSWGKSRQALVFGSELKYALSARRGRKPDVSMFSPGVRLTRGNLVRIPPMLMVEVLTPTPRDMRRDRVDKMAEYAFFGVRSYWIVDPVKRSIECYELSKRGQVFRSVTATRGQVEVPNFDGLVLDLDDLWGEVNLVEDDEPTET